MSRKNRPPRERAAAPLFVVLAPVAAVNLLILAQPLGARHTM